MRTLIPLAALLLAAACAGPADPAGAPAEASPSVSASPRTWDGLPEAELSASTTVTAEEYVPPPEPAPEPTDDAGLTPDDPFYRPPGMDPCEPNEHGFEDNDACLEQHGYPHPG